MHKSINNLSNERGKYSLIAFCLQKKRFGPFLYNDFLLFCFVLGTEKQKHPKNKNINNRK